MGRLIDSQTAYDVLTDYYHHSTDAQHAALREALGRVESVDAVPVRHGKWEKHKGIFICSRCLTGYKEQPTMMGKPLFEFCPVCGAKMDGKDGDGNGL